MIQGTTTETAADVRPWRKRHPVLSRAILYTLGLALGTLLVVLWNQRKDEDRDTELDAIQQQIDGLGLVLAADPTGDELLALLDENFAGEDLPQKARQRSLRWRAMAWRRKAESAGGATDRDAAYARADEAFAAAEALDLPAEERYALQLEQVEARLARRDTAGAREILPSLDAATSVSPALLRQFLLAQLLRLEGHTGKASDLLRDTLRGVEGPLQQGHDAYVGGREWSPLQVVIEMAAFVTTQEGRAGDAALWGQIRRLGADVYEAQKAAAAGLAALGSDDQALAAWRAATRLDPRLAGIEAGRDPALAALQRRLAGL